MKKMYIVINKDLDMSPGKIGAHSAHAVFDYLFNNYFGITKDRFTLEEEMIQQYSNFLNDFKYDGDTIVLLKASEKEMLKFEQQGYTAVRDAGRTEVKPNSLTAINLGIYDKEDVPKFIQRLRLL